MSHDHGETSGPLWRLGRAAPVLAGVALSLAGCTEPVQQPSTAGRSGFSGYYTPPPPSYYYTPPPSYYPPPNYRSPGVDAAVPITPAPRSYFPPLIPRAEAQEPAPVPYRPAEALPSAPDEVPVDPSCGWWRLCHLWGGS